jgi:hypothetical protein
MKKILLLFAVMCFVITTVNSQPYYYHNWYFGGNGMLTFLSTSGNPEKTKYSAMYAKEGATSISNADGDILFYSNGQTVWNFNNEIMDNGTGLLGDNSAPQGAFAVPFPGDDSRFYLFTMAASENSSAGLRYSIVDMVDNEGFGKVIEKNTLIRANMSEAMTLALYNGGNDLCEGQGYWLLAKPNGSNQILSFKVDSSGIGNPVSSSIDGISSIYQIKVSHDRERVAITHRNGVKICGFNDLTGKLSIQHSMDIASCYGVEFSPNNELLYVTSYQAGEIHQIDLTDNYNVHIFNSDEVNQVHSLQLGPDNRIYVSSAGEKFLGRFNNANSFGVNAGYIANAISIDPYACQWGLPQYISDIQECEAKVIRKIYVLNNELCEGDVLVLYARDLDNATYSWTAPNGDKFSGSVVRTFAKEAYDGIFNLKVKFSNGEEIDLQAEINVVPGPEFRITGDTTLCGDDDIVQLSAKSFQKLDTMYWNTDYVTVDSTLTLAYITEPGEYIVYGRNKAGCEDSTIVNIVKFDLVEAEIQGESVICYTDETTLEAFPQGEDGEYEYEWSTGATTPDITVSDTTEYWVRVYQVGGCWDTARVNVEYFEPYVPEYNIESPVTICDGDVINLELLNPNPLYDYEWENGSRITDRAFSEEGEYILSVVTTDGCTYHDTLLVFTRESPEAKILQGESIVSCGGTPVELEAMEVETDYYTWSTGETTRTITVNQTDVYWVAVGFNGTACLDTAWIDVQFDDNLSVTINGDAKICGDNSTILSTNYVGDLFKYEWSTGETTPEITVTDAGEYTVRVYTDSGCEDTGEFTVEKFDQPDIALNYDGVVEICDGEQIELVPQNAQSAHNNYWTDGVTTLSRVVTTSGTYTFVSENDICVDTAFVEVIVNEVPDITINASGTSLCLTPEIDLTVEPFNPDYTYTWSTGETGESITITDADTYEVEVETDKGCKNVTQITIDESGDIQFNITPGEVIDICEGESLELSVDTEFAQYEWSTGATTRSITVTEAGTYSVTVYDETGCSSTKEAVVNVNKSELALSTNSIDFGELCIGETSEMTFSVTNTNENDITISSIEFYLNNTYYSGEYRVSNSYTDVLNPSETKEYSITFAPEVPDNWVGEAIVTISEPCETSYAINLEAISVHRTEFDLPELVKDAGEEGVEVALSIDHLCEVTNSFSSDFRAVIKYNVFFYSSEDVTKDGFDVNVTSQGYEKFAEVNGSYNFGSSAAQSILTLVGQALVGDSTESPITLEEFEWLNDNIYYEKNPGSIEINPFCQQDVYKLEFFQLTEMSISPNPVEEFINASIITEEEGRFNLMIVNSMGKTIKEYTFTNKGLMDENIQIPVDDLSSGVYNVILKAPWSMRSQQIVITK